MFLFLVKFLTFLLIVESSVLPQLKKNKHQEFFDSLTPTEQEWVVRLGIRHEASVLQCPHANGTRFLPPGQSKPAPVDHLELIPATVMEKMLNGDVSGKFQSELIKWLKKDLRFSDADFHKFQLQSPEFCSDDGCMSISNIGGICCPFG